MGDVDKFYVQMVLESLFVVLPQPATHLFLTEKLKVHLQLYDCCSTRFKVLVIMQPKINSLKGLMLRIYYS